MSNSNHIITYRFERIRKNGNGHEIIGKRMYHETGATAREGEFSHPVSYVMLRNDNRYLLQMRSDKVTNPHTFDFSSAGHVDYRETLEESALREGLEELGINLKKEDLKEFYFFPSKTNPKHLVFGFTVDYNENIHGKVNPEKDGEVDPNGTEFYSKEKLKELYQNGKINPNLQHYFEERAGINLEAKNE